MNGTTSDSLTLTLLQCTKREKKKKEGKKKRIRRGLTTRANKRTEISEREEKGESEIGKETEKN